MSNQLLREALEEMVRCAQKQNWRDNYPSAMDKAYAALDATKQTQPAAGGPVAKYRERSNHHVIRRDESLPCYCWAESDHRIGQEVAAPPAAAHGDEAVRIKLPEFIRCSDAMHERGKHAVERAIEDQCFGRWTQFQVYFEAAIQEWLSQQEDAAMRAQGDGEVQ